MQQSPLPGDVEPLARQVSGLALPTRRIRRNGAGVLLKCGEATLLVGEEVQGGEGPLPGGHVLALEAAPPPSDTGDAGTRHR